MPELGAALPPLLLAGVPSLLYVLILRAIDRYEPDPWRILLTALALGALVVPLAVMAVRVLIGQPFELPLPYGAGGPQPLVRVIEQVLGGFVLIGLVATLRREFDNALDGVVWGAAVGAGLGAAHTFLFAYGGTGLLGEETIALVTVSGLNQAFYGAVFGAFLGYAVWYLPRQRAWVVISLGLATAALLSALHDTLPYILSRLIDRPDAATGVATRLLAFSLNVLGLFALAAVVLHFWRHEADVLRRHLRPEVEQGTISRQHYEMITSARARAARQLHLLRQGRLREVRLLRNLFVAEGKLAFHNWHRRMGRRGPAADEREQELRERVRRLERELEEAHGR